jgi:hypothetical protein
LTTSCSFGSSITSVGIGEIRDEGVIVSLFWIVIVSVSTRELDCSNDTISSKLSKRGRESFSDRIRSYTDSYSELKGKGRC